MSLTHIYLAVAIAFEVIATSALKESAGFTRLVPSLIAACGYAIAFYLLSLALRSMPVGIVYAVWAGAGIVLITAVGWLVFKQSLDLPAMIGIALIVAGVLIINLLSKTVSH